MEKAPKAREKTSEQEELDAAHAKPVEEKEETVVFDKEGNLRGLDIENA